MKRPPQFDLPGAELIFNLQSETTLDGDRLAAEKQQSDHAKTENDKKQPRLLGE